MHDSQLNLTCSESLSPRLRTAGVGASLGGNSFSTGIPASSSDLPDALGAVGLLLRQLKLEMEPQSLLDVLDGEVMQVGDVGDNEELPL